jgi:tetratricopeptide (TPR) repeat protein
MTPLWQIQIFTVGRPMIFHIFVETGLLGFFSFLSIFFVLSRKILRLDHPSKYGPILLVTYLFIAAWIVPPSITYFFLLFVSAGLLESDLSLSDDSFLKNRYTIKLTGQSRIILYSIGASLVTLGLISALFSLSTAYSADHFYRKSLEAVFTGSPQELYDNQQQAVNLNPYIEQYHIQFAQTNLLIANGLAERSTTTKTELTPQERQIISASIQTAIAQGKAAAILNPQKPLNWSTLGSVYKNVLQVAKGSDAWAISAYQRAMVLDPTNPSNPLELGGIYYTLGRYDDALLSFQRAAVLKPDWQNAYYNLAWTYFKKGQKNQAQVSMKKVLELLKNNTGSADYQRALQDLKQISM